MLIRKSLLFFTLIFSIVALFAATEVWAECDKSANEADYSITCGEQENYTVSIVEPFPEIAPCGAPYTGENCSTYRWNIDPSMSHFNLIVEAFFEDKIVASNSVEVVPGKILDCSGLGDRSTGAELFGQFLTWHCTLRFETDSPFVTLRGEFGSTPTDWQVKQSQDFANGDYGITRGLAELCTREATGVVTSSRICVNLPGTEKLGDEAHYWFFRNNDAENCVDTTKDLYICIGTCPDRLEDEPAGACEKLTGSPDAVHIVGSNLVGDSCPDELFKQTLGNSPFYHYETWAGGYYYEACYDYGASPPGWVAPSNCP